MAEWDLQIFYKLLKTEPHISLLNIELEHVHSLRPWVSFRLNYLAYLTARMSVSVLWRVFIEVLSLQ